MANTSTIKSTSALEMYSDSMQPSIFKGIKRKIGEHKYAKLDLDKIEQIGKEFGAVYFRLLDYKIEMEKKLSSPTLWVSNFDPALRLAAACQTSLEQHVIYFYYRLARNDKPINEMRVKLPVDDTSLSAETEQMLGLGHEVAEEVLGQFIKFAIVIGKRYHSDQIRTFSSPPITLWANETRTGVMPAIF